jgi:hypothetical protein
VTDDRNEIDDFVDVAPEEKAFMHLWNVFVQRHPIYCDRWGAASPPMQRYSDAKVANRTRVGTGRQRMVLERGTHPKLSRRTCISQVRATLVSREIGARGPNGRVNNLPPETPNVFDSFNFCIACSPSCPVLAALPHAVGCIQEPRSTQTQV